MGWVDCPWLNNVCSRIVCGFVLVNHFGCDVLFLFVHAGMPISSPLCLCTVFVQKYLSFRQL
eukprot:NODE_4136_length_331_cov_6.056738_g4054_i0.p2 GENE.NODE_4136_length_331_cov_6.056738_g4054_i0~~NODE_4136_length_331_cov_6.056738_g4054_i0.p2  ORF type:complete len:62 (+),score=0.14 NODE_4136_length_331_cov_6.056738_g4054_i0:131-316(+)